MAQRSSAEPKMPELERKKFFSFDGGVREVAAYHRPDRYRELEKSLGTRHRIPRGGGYSYAAASFGKTSIVQDLTRFNRILKFEPEHGLVTVEAGVTLADLLDLTIPAGLWLPVIPGYPKITIGGCVAANVHGKNPAANGTFRNYVKEITLFHPAYGSITVNERCQPDIFELTCGGYGLTGIILSVTLRLEHLPGSRCLLKRIEVASLLEAYQVIVDSSASSQFAYSMHQAHVEPLKLGRGFVNCGQMPLDSPSPEWRIPNYRVVTASNRGVIPFSIFGGSRTPLILTAHWFLENTKKKEISEPLFEGMFPFARNGYYFRLYGKAGLAEYQMLIPFKETQQFLTELQSVMLKEKPPAVMASLKLFKGKQRLLRFEMDGTCLALDLVRCARTERFLTILDDMLISASGIPYLIKDSRLPQQVARLCYPHYELMRKALHDFDPQRLYRSEMSERLAL